MKIEVKNKENQRLSMANEQLQFRLQSHPNLSSNQDSLLNSSSYASFSDENKDSIETTKPHHQYQPQPRHARASTMHPSSVTSSEDSEEINLISSQAPQVKLRSKSFKSQNLPNKTSDSNKSINKSLHNNLGYQNNKFRPVSDTFNFNLNDQNINMTKSFNVMYDKHNNSSSSNDNYFDLDRNEENCNKLTLDDCDECNDESGGSSSSLKSSSILDANFDCIKDEDQMTKSVPCMVLKNTNNDTTHRQTEFSDEEMLYIKTSDLENGSSLC
jgi:hypothetical protein